MLSALLGFAAWMLKAQIILILSAYLLGIIMGMWAASKVTQTN